MSDEPRQLRVVEDSPPRVGSRWPESVHALAHLLACLDKAAKCCRDCLEDATATVIEAHRAHLARGEEWPGETVTSPFGAEIVDNDRDLTARGVALCETAARALGVTNDRKETLCSKTVIS